MKPIEEHIDRYMNGQMSESERESFEAEMAQNSELKALVDNYDQVKKTAELAVELAREEKLLSEVKSITSAEPAKPAPSNMEKYRLILIASAAILAALLYFFKPDQLPAVNQDDIMAYYQPLPFEDNVRSVDPSEEDGFRKAQDFFQKNEREKCIALLVDIISNSKNPDKLKDAKELLAHAYFIEEDYGKAKKLFEEIGAEQNKCNIQLCRIIVEGASMDSLKEICVRQ